MWLGRDLAILSILTAGNRSGGEITVLSDLMLPKQSGGAITVQSILTPFSRSARVWDTLTLDGDLKSYLSICVTLTQIRSKAFLSV